MNIHAKCLDCRSESDYLTGHLSRAFHIPSDQLFERMHELPRTDEPLSVIIDHKSEKQSQAFFSDKAYENVDYIFWSEIQSLVSPVNLSQGPAGKNIKLWEPSPLINEFIEQHLNQLTPSSQLTGLDIACGSGRDLVCLSQAGFSMHGIDYNQGSLDRCHDLAKRHGQQVELRCADIERNEHALLEHYKHEQFDLIIVFRYLHRPLLKDIRSLLKPGGILIYSTFMKGCEEISRPKNPRFLLSPNELSKEFGTSTGFSIIMDRVSRLNDGRPVAEFISIKA